MKFQMPCSCSEAKNCIVSNFEKHEEKCSQKTKLSELWSHMPDNPHKIQFHYHFI